MLYIASLLLIGLPAIFVAACRLFPALPDFWMGAVFPPVARSVSCAPTPPDTGSAIASE